MESEYIGIFETLFAVVLLIFMREYIHILMHIGGGIFNLCSTVHCTTFLSKQGRMEEGWDTYCGIVECVIYHQCEYNR